jgi:tRNA(Ile)-lysidine synthase
LAAVSGGPDSLCLLDGLVRLGFPVIAAYFDHALRAESQADGLYVRDAAVRLGASFVSAREDVALYARQNHLTLEEAARTLRYRFLFEQARIFSTQAVAVGHTADDQVETVLMHLLRGAGPQGLSGMPQRALIATFDAGIPLVRPLLPFWRAETVQYCRERSLAPIIDPSNQDVVFFRNRLRHELLPLLEQYNPRIREALLRTSQILAADDAVVQLAVQSTWDDVFIEQVGMAAEPPDSVALNLERFRALPVGLQRALLRRAISLLLPALHNLDFAAVDRALRWSANSREGRVDLVSGLRVIIEGQRLWIARADALPAEPAWPAADAEGAELAVPGTVSFSSGWELAAEWQDAADAVSFVQEDASPWVARLDAEQIAAPLTVRKMLAGDRFQPLGLNGHTVKLSDFWINQKVPRRARQDWPLVLSAGEIIWVPGYRLSNAYRVQPTTRRMLVLRLSRKG